ncbi:hypothetical protein KVT40_009351 [Elsinoe batatas]|uniref:Integral membrane protein n=1 Tax=Elsinoe batatas TaxID=2601811 RepID=A0A8K0KVQ9_9PEZI|nr:hypothetical protein KVT40_009351 [Elsinoe batatas]
MEPMQASLFIASIVIAVLSSLVVGLRCVARTLIRGFWIDDYLMIATQVLFITTCVLSATASVDGIGVRDQDPASGYAGPRDYSAARQASLTTHRKLGYYLWGLADPYLWTLIECGVAIIVGSIPSLRPLLKRSTIMSTDQKSKSVSRRDTIPHETPRVPSHRSQIILHPRLSQGGSDSYELLNSEADLFKTITTTRMEMAEAPNGQWV